MSALCHGCGTQIDEDEDTLCPKCRQGGTMTNEDRAEILIDTVQNVPTYREAKEAILAYAEEIRRECADRAVEHLEGSYDPEAGAWAWTMSGLRAAIMGKEVKNGL